MNAMKAFLGMGLIGSNFVRGMTGKGEYPQIWNRTWSKAVRMEQYGAKAFTKVADAVKNASVIHLSLRDDAAVDEVLTGAKLGLKPGSVIIDHSTTSVSGAISRTAKWSRLGYEYLHAPVFMGPKNAFESTGIMLVSGDQELIRKLEPDLSAMTGKLVNLGAEPGRAAGMKLAGNLFLMTITAGIADTLRLGGALNIAAEDIIDLFGCWNPALNLPERVKKMALGDYQTVSWDLDMARKDAGLIIKEGKGNLRMLPAIAAEMDSWIAKGFGNSDWTIIGSIAHQLN
jgi:3-hydroxyisobutyrate dehydrogenase